MARIAVLTVPSPQSWIIVNALMRHFGPVTILAEERQSRLAEMRGKIRRQGIVAVLGQIGFVLLQKHLAQRGDPKG
jgi:hypothetical protein